MTMVGKLAIIIGCSTVILLFFWLTAKTTQTKRYVLLPLSIVLIVTLQAHFYGLLGAIIATAALLLMSVLVFSAAEQLRNNRRPALLFSMICVVLLPLLLFRYMLPGQIGLWIPLGISYYSFKHIHYLIDSSRGKYDGAKLSDYLSYIYFFPMFMAGPLERFGAFQTQTSSFSFSWKSFSLSCERILIGAIQKFFLADIFFRSLLLPGHLLQQHHDSIAWYTLLFGCTMKWLMTYCDFAGYTHMALGVAGLFGVRLCENFNFPMLRSNLAEFWRSWHMSLASWARDYVYFPILGRYRLTSLALVATMVSIGAWHGLQPGWLLWGLHHGFGLSLLGKYQRWASRYQWLQNLRNTVAWRVMGMFAVWYYVSLAYALTYIPGNLTLALSVYSKILTFGMLP